MQQDKFEARCAEMQVEKAEHKKAVELEKDEIHKRRRERQCGHLL